MAVVYERCRCWFRLLTEAVGGGSAAVGFSRCRRRCTGRSCRWRFSRQLSVRIYIWRPWLQEKLVVIAEISSDDEQEGW